MPLKLIGAVAEKQLQVQQAFIAAHDGVAGAEEVLQQRQAELAEMVPDAVERQAMLETGLQTWALQYGVDLSPQIKQQQFLQSSNYGEMQTWLAQQPVQAGIMPTGGDFTEWLPWIMIGGAVLFMLVGMGRRS